MRTLLWKDFRQSWRLMVGSAIVVLGIPYAICLVVAFRSSLRTDYAPFTYSDALEGASKTGIILSIILAAIFSGNAFSGERSDRSAEFFAYIPVKKWAVVWSRLAIAIMSCAFFFVANLLVMLVFEESPREFNAEVIGNMVLAGVFVFGMNWFFSSFLASPLLSSFFGPVIGMTVYMLCALIYEDYAADSLEELLGFWFVLASIFGLVGVVGGSVIYVRRVEP